jgi:Phytanoyl-CoA dioxygenase (PhyH)
MTTVYVDPSFDDETRRHHLFAGDLLVYTPRPSSVALIDHAREMIEESFDGKDPELAQFDMEVEAYAALLADLKPRFIHHPRSKERIRDLLTDLGADIDRTYFDVPRMRSSTSNNYLTSGIAYAFHPHRDTWYSAPMAQVNFWIPIYPISADNGVAFHPRYFDSPVKNGSSDYDYVEWTQTSRIEAAKHIHKDTRVQPKAEEAVELDPQIRPVMPAGGVLVFSGAQFHSSVPNDSGRTRFSIDFRTVNLDDLERGDSAPNVDSDCTSTTLGDFLQAHDLSTHVPADLIDRYDIRREPVSDPA